MKTTTQKFALAVVAPMLLVVSSLSYAGTYCVPTRVLINPQLLNVGTQVVNGPIAAGTRIGSFKGSIGPGITTFDGCARRDVASSFARSTKSAVSSWNGYSIYPTGIPGIGYIIEVADGRVEPFIYLTSNATGPGHRIYNDLFDFGLGFRVNVWFFATATLGGGSYSIPSQDLAITRSRDYQATSIDGPGASSMIRLNGFTLNVRGPTCDLATSDLNRTVTLSTIRLSDFTGAIAGRTTFDLTANCSDNPSTVTFKFTGTPDPANTQLFKNTGTAANVGLYLYTQSGSTDSIIGANGSNNTRTVSVSGNRAVLTLGAAYYRNGTPGKGTLASTATVNITYN